MISILEDQSGARLKSWQVTQQRFKRGFRLHHCIMLKSWLERQLWERLRKTTGVQRIKISQQLAVPAFYNMEIGTVGTLK